MWWYYSQVFRHSVDCGLHMSNALSFLKGDVFIGVISYHYTQSWLSIYIVNAIKYIDFGVNPLFCMLITNKNATWSCKLWPLNLIGTMPLCLGGIFSVYLNRAILCRSSLFLVYVRKEPSICIKRCLSESQQYNNEYHFCKSMPKRKSASCSLSHMKKYAKIWNLLSRGEELLFLWKTWVTHLQSIGSLLQAVYRSCSDLQSCCMCLCALRKWWHQSLSRF